jgi:cytochrome c oxidase subunit I
MNDYRFEIQRGTPVELARLWLGLGVAALIGAGLLALLLGLSRTPGIQDVFPLKDFFRSALVVHVDLSVFVWFMSFASVVWSLCGGQTLAALGRIGFYLAAFGTLVMTVSPFFPDAQPLLNNYIPVLQQPVFFGGLLIAGIGFGLTIVRALLTIKFISPVGAGDTPSVITTAAKGESTLRFGAFLAAVAGAVSFLGVAYALLFPPSVDGQPFWEAVFWGGGHTLQFQHALLMVVAWLWLLSEVRHAPTTSPRMMFGLFALAALPVAVAPTLYFVAPVGTAWHTLYFAKLMEHGHPLMVPLILIVTLAAWRARGVSAPAKSALYASLFLFTAGGVLAYLIRGVNVVIPAHYHGSIVGVTLAFMGVAYLLLPRIGFGELTGKIAKTARWQPYVYGGGQFMHIMGLAVSGGYGVQRKVAGAEQMLTTVPQKIAMGVMGMGSLVSVIGGVMFVVVCLVAMKRSTNTNAA